MQPSLNMKILLVYTHIHTADATFSNGIICAIQVKVNGHLSDSHNEDTVRWKFLRVDGAA